MTNGEKIKEIFPSTDSRLDERTGIMLVKWVDGATKCFKADWWNAEYKEPTTKNDLGVDCISRAEMLRYQQYLHGKMSNEENHKLWEFVKELPSVTPQQREGHWIDDTRLGYHVSVCSNCNWRGHGDTCLIYKPKFCPNCGAKMVEPQESGGMKNEMWKMRIFLQVSKS